MIVGPIISVDDWVPERPPKNPLLRIPSPELPPPPPPPVIQIETEVETINQDEPLPPPPPELLRHMRQLSEPDNKINPACRRNSFAGSTTKKPLFRAGTFENLSPPIVPKKPVPADNILSRQRPASSLAKTQIQTHQAHRVILNGKNDNSLPVSVTGRLSDTRLSLRKRTHNSHVPIDFGMKNVMVPPPLKPRMPVFAETIKSNGIREVLGSKFR